MGNRVNQDGSAARVPSSSRYFITSPSPLTLTPHSHSLTFTPFHLHTLSPSLSPPHLHPLSHSLTPSPSHPFTFTSLSHSHPHSLFSLLPFLSFYRLLLFTSLTSFTFLSPVNLSTVSVFFETVLAVSPVCLYAPWFEYLAF